MGIPSCCRILQNYRPKTRGNQKKQINLPAMGKRVYCWDDILAKAWDFSPENDDGKAPRPPGLEQRNRAARKGKR
jgi:hypothetical protein